MGGRRDWILESEWRATRLLKETLMEYLKRGGHQMTTSFIQQVQDFMCERTGIRPAPQAITKAVNMVQLLCLGGNQQLDQLSMMLGVLVALGEEAGHAN